MAGIALIIGIAAAFNLLILLVKFKAGRYGDFSMDIMALIVLTTIFGNTILGMLIATVASMTISIYLLIFYV